MHRPTNEPRSQIYNQVGKIAHFTGQNSSKMGMNGYFQASRVLGMLIVIFGLFTNIVCYVAQSVVQNLQESTEPAPAELLSQYPSMLCVAVLPSPDGSAPIRALHRCALLGLEARHSSGVHAIIPPLHSALCDVYLSSGFTDISALWKRKDGSKVFGKRLTSVE